VGAVVVSTVEVLVVVACTGVPVSVGNVSPVPVLVAVAFVMAVLMAAITDSPMMSSSAASAIQGGGTGVIPTDITATAITRTITMDTGDTHTVTMGTVATRTAMDTAGTVTTVAAVMAIAMQAEPVTDTARAADQDIPGMCGVADKPATGRSEGDRSFWPGTERDSRDATKLSATGAAS
jgi:hypothetical protein